MEKWDQYRAENWKNGGIPYINKGGLKQDSMNDKLHEGGNQMAQLNI